MQEKGAWSESILNLPQPDRSMPGQGRRANIALLTTVIALHNESRVVVGLARAPAADSVQALAVVVEPEPAAARDREPAAALAPGLAVVAEPGPAVAPAWAWAVAESTR